MSVVVFGREIVARVEPLRGGYFLRCSQAEGERVNPGTPVEVNGRPFVVRHVMRFPAGEPELWARLMPRGGRPSR